MSGWYWFEGEELHFDVPLVLRNLGLPDTPENRDTMTALLADEARKMVPNAEVKVVCNAT